MTELPEDVKKVIGNREVNNAAIMVSYRNYRGETSDRRIIPLQVYYGNTEHHKEDQWLLKVWDLEKENYRDYAFKDIVEWKKFP